MLLRVNHATTYRYGETVGYSIQSLKLMPRDGTNQTVQDWTITVNGEPAENGFDDGYGNRVITAVVDEPHESVEVVAAGTVATRDTSGVFDGPSGTMPKGVFLRTTPLTASDEAIGKLAASLEPQGSRVDQFHDLMASLRKHMTFETGSTHSGTTAAEAFGGATGVCQDYTHIFVAACRHARVPARYVSGYMHEGEDVTSAEAKHAWAEVWIGNLGWVGFDAANGVCPTDHYVRVACGLDAHDVAPIRGARRGGGDEELAIRVEVAEAQSQQQ